MEESDEGIFEESEIGKLLEQQFGLSPDELLPGQTETPTHVVIGDEAFGLKPYLMRPFPYAQSKNDSVKGKYNKGLCRARRVVENAFGMLTMKWRLFLRPIEMSQQNNTYCLSCVFASQFFTLREFRSTIMDLINWNRNMGG